MKISISWAWLIKYLLNSSKKEGKGCVEGIEGCSAFFILYFRILTILAEKIGQIQLPALEFQCMFY